MEATSYLHYDENTHSSCNSSATTHSHSTPNWKHLSSVLSLDESVLPLASDWGNLDLNVEGSNQPGNVQQDKHSGWGDLEINVDDTQNDKQLNSNDVHNEEFNNVHNESDNEECDSMSATHSPLGVLHSLPNTFLLLCDSPLNVPITQELRVMTSDQFEEQMELFTRLGSSAEGSAMRTELQCASLISDMQSFKAANPRCIFEDFVRWHSPKDWREKDGTRRGQLSMRMKANNNIWKNAWKKAQPIPAKQQTQLFDSHLEAEQVFNYLETIVPHALFSQLLGIAIGNTICVLGRTPAAIAGIPFVITRLLRLHPYLHVAHLPTDVCEEVAQVEIACARATALIQITPNQHNIIQQLMEHSQYTWKTDETSARQDIRNMFEQRHSSTNTTSNSTSTASSSSPAPDWIEYILFSPTTICSHVGHRLYVCIRSAQADEEISDPLSSFFIPKFRMSSSYIQKQFIE
jgi:hypothetical protein